MGEFLSSVCLCANIAAYIFFNFSMICVRSSGDFVPCNVLSNWFLLVIYSRISSNSGLNDMCLIRPFISLKIGWRSLFLRSICCWLSKSDCISLSLPCSYSMASFCSLAWYSPKFKTVYGMMTSESIFESRVLRDGQNRFCSISMALSMSLSLTRFRVCFMSDLRILSNNKSSFFLRRSSFF